MHKTEKSEANVNDRRTVYRSTMTDNEVIQTQPLIDEVIQTPALGRPFRLGMLYDRKRDMIIPGEELWTKEVLHGHTTSQEHPGCDFDVIYGDTMEDKKVVFEADANLKLNFLKGILKLGSSGKYLSDRKTSEHKVRISLRCNCFTHYNQISIPSSVSNDILKQTNATHVVVAIKYGAQVIFVFERSVSAKEDKVKINGELQGMIENIPVVSLEGSGDINTTETELKKEESVTCKYYGDIILPSNPTSFQDAIDAYKTLPSRLEKDKAAPVTVWLYPLSKLDSKLDSKPRQITQMVDQRNLERLEEIFECLQCIQINLNDLLLKDACKHIPEFRKQITSFRGHIRTYQQVFQTQIAELLNEEKNTDPRRASNILSKHARSPFERSALEEWISKRESEHKMLTSFINKLMPPISDDAQFYVTLFEFDNVILLQIFLPLSKDDILSKMKTHIEALSGGQSTSIRDLNPNPSLLQTPETVGFGNLEEFVWYHDQNILSTIRDTMKRFQEMKEQNTAKINLKFVVMISDVKSCDVSNCVKLSLYQNAMLKKDQVTSDDLSEL